MGFCCCECYLNKGCVDLCVPFDTGQTAAIEGEYCLIYKVDATRREICEYFYISAPLIFDISDLLPGMTYEAIIKDPDGVQIDLTDGTIDTYDCMRFSVEQTQEFISDNEEVTGEVVIKKSDGSQLAIVPCGNEYTLSGSDVFESDGVTLIEHLEDGENETLQGSDVFESDGTTLVEHLEDGENKTLQGATVTDTDGGHLLEDGDSYSCLPCPQTVEAFILFLAGEDTANVTFPFAATFTSETATSNITYDGNPFGAGFSVIANQTVVVVRDDTTNDETVILTGTY